MATEAVIKGSIVVQGVPASACFTNFADLLNSLGQYLSVALPNQSFSNLVVSTAQPGQADRGKIWARISNSGVFVGFFLYSATTQTWNQIFPVPQEIFLLYGSSASPPPGFKFLEVTDGILSAPDYAELIANVAVPAAGPPYTVYPAIYVGT